MRFDAHGLPERGIVREFFHLRREIRDVERAGDVAGGAMDDEIARPALIRNHARHAAGERLENDIAKSVRGAREEEDIRAGKGAGEVQAGEDAGLSGVGQDLTQVFQVRAVADEGEGEGRDGWMRDGG